MVFSIYLSVIAMSILTFLVVKKKLPMVEHLFIWMLFGFIYTIFVDMGPQMHAFKSSDRLDYHWAQWLIELTIIPIVILFCLDRMVSLRTGLSKAAAIAVCIGVLLGVEAIDVKLELIQYENWNFVRSFFVWSVLVILMALAQKWFAKKMIKEGYR